MSTQASVFLNAKLQTKHDPNSPSLVPMSPKTQNAYQQARVASLRGEMVARTLNMTTLLGGLCY